MPNRGADELTWRLASLCCRFFDEVLVSPPPDNEILMKSLTLLDLQNNKIGDRGAVSLSYLLGGGSLLSKMFLSSNR